MMNNKKIPFENWQAKQLRELPNCYEDGTGNGEFTFFSILKTCARKYPEHLEKFAKRFNAEKCFPPFKGSEFTHKVSDARRLAGLSVSSRSYTGGSLWNAHKPKLEPQKVSRMVQSIAAAITPDFLWWRSPIVPDAMSATSFLKVLYKDGDKIFVTDTFNRKKPSELVTIAPVMYCPTLEHIAANNQSGVWFLPNPVSGQWVESGDGRSMRCEAALTAWRFCVIESDTVTEADWLKILCSLPLPVAAIYRSGGKSIHGLLKVNAESADDWKTKVAPLKAALTPLGVDPAAMRVSQLSRLPQCLRTDKGQWQKLLYLDPEPDGVPIMEKPLRETREAIQARMSEALKMLGEDGEPFPEVTIPEGGADGK
jgi:hypothetical protein